jgi:hypothetical protein
MLHRSRRLIGMGIALFILVLAPLVPTTTPTKAKRCGSGQGSTPARMFGESLVDLGESDRGDLDGCALVCSSSKTRASAATSAVWPSHDLRRCA